MKNSAVNTKFLSKNKVFSAQLVLRQVDLRPNRSRFEYCDSSSTFVGVGPCQSLLLHMESGTVSEPSEKHDQIKSCSPKSPNPKTTYLCDVDLSKAFHTKFIKAK